MNKLKIIILVCLLFAGSNFLVAGSNTIDEPNPLVEAEKSEQTTTSSETNPPTPPSTPPVEPNKVETEKEKASEVVKEVSPNKPARPQRTRARPPTGARPEIIRPERGRPAGAGRPQGARRPGRN